jgi:2'-5' RNA ligase
VRASHPNVRWLAPEKLHLTLLFLGATEPSRADFLAQAIDATALGHAPFDVTTGEAGGRIGGHGGGVAWLRLARGSQEVQRLSLAIGDAIGRGIYDAVKAPLPHLTVARGIDGRVMSDLGTLAVEIQLAWTVDRIVLFRSHTEPSGSRYDVIASAQLTT